MFWGLAPSHFEKENYTICTLGHDYRDVADIKGWGIKCDLV